MLFEIAFRISDVLYIERKQISIEDSRIKLIVKSKGDRIITAFLSKDTSKRLADWINSNKIKKGRVFNLGYDAFEANLKKYGREILDRDISSHFGKVSRAMYEFGTRGTDVRKVQQILHHKDINTTLIYLQESGLDSKKEMKEREKDMIWGN
jgi:integrase